MAWHGFVNFQSSCFMDSVLVALFCADHASCFRRALLGSGGKTKPSRLPNATEEWQAAVRRALSNEVAMLSQSRTAGHPCVAFRALLRGVPRQTTTQFGDTVSINFASPQQQSAVDFLHYLFDALAPAKGMAEVQHSTTFVKRRPAVVQHPELPALVQAWKQHPVTARYTRDNAAQLDDESERAALLGDRSGEASIIENAAGDRRRISAPEQVVLFSCHLREDDRNAAVISILRDIEPQVEFMDRIEGYAGPWFAKLLACRVRRVAVLIVEVARKVTMAHKLDTPVMYGTEEGGQVVLHMEREYVLTAVVCHVGTAMHGHYVAYVCGDSGDWYFYDDALAEGKLLLVPEGVSGLEANQLLAPSVHGELFFYVPNS